VSYSSLLDRQKRVIGYRLAWHASSQAAAAAAPAAHFKAMLSCVARNLNPPKQGWRLGECVVFLDVSVECLFAEELQALPPEKVVLCLCGNDFADPDTQSMLMFLRAQGFGLMLCGADALPDGPEALSLITHMDVGSGDANLIASVRRAAEPGRPHIHPIATEIRSWRDFDACAARGVDVFVNGQDALVPWEEVSGTLQPEAMLIVRLMQMIQRNEDVRAIEAALKHDPALTYRLLHHINSPSIGGGVEVQSLRHAVAMLGYSPLFRWLMLLLATSNTASAAFMTKKAIMRGRFVELMGQGMLPPGQGDNLFVVGMFSLIDRLLGVSMGEVLSKVHVSEAVHLAILKREGLYAPFLSLAETCEIDCGEAERLSEALLMSSDQVNDAHLQALAWAQDVSRAEAAY